MVTMTFDRKIATIFGGTGFLGRQIVRRLAARGVIVKIATRVPERANEMKTYGAVGQVVPIACDYKPESIAAAVEGSDFVVNCIGILFEKGKKSTFKRAHVETPAMIAQACRAAKVNRFVHISALGCDVASSQYGKTKREGEQKVFEIYPSAVILRPSIIFGEDDNFFNMFAEMARFLPVLPLIGGGKTKFQPVYVGDVADAALEALICENTKDAGFYDGKIFELGGTEVLNFAQIYERLFHYTGRKRCLMSLPFSLAKVQASFLSILPSPPLTRDQVESLKTDSVVREGSLGFDRFKIVPKALDLILPQYLARYKSGGVFADRRNVDAG